MNKKTWNKFICWIFGHCFDDAIPVEHEDNEEMRAAGFPGRMLLFAYCSRCGDGPWRLT